MQSIQFRLVFQRNTYFFRACNYSLSFFMSVNHSRTQTYATTVMNNDRKLIICKEKRNVSLFLYVYKNKTKQKYTQFFLHNFLYVLTRTLSIISLSIFFSFCLQFISNNRLQAVISFVIIVSGVLNIRLIKIHSNQFIEISVQNAFYSHYIQVRIILQ